MELAQAQINKIGWAVQGESHGICYSHSLTTFDTCLPTLVPDFSEQ